MPLLLAPKSRGGPLGDLDSAVVTSLKACTGAAAHQICSVFTCARPAFFAR